MDARLARAAGGTDGALAPVVKRAIDQLRSERRAAAAQALELQRMEEESRSLREQIAAIKAKILVLEHASHVTRQERGRHGREHAQEHDDDFDWRMVMNAVGVASERTGESDLTLMNELDARVMSFLGPETTDPSAVAEQEPSDALLARVSRLRVMWKEAIENVSSARQRTYHLKKVVADLRGDIDLLYECHPQLQSASSPSGATSVAASPDPVRRLSL
eukprot:TRINITY_DN5604_c0_g1_i1.p1 TRINITY_DN5604_c0_g1~~TRINITY_DN5604_c0_g1_i1.p1  ORF type:complete len:219 (+),score=47.71 TRINITY_DN5604_c0_g1_i1:100-756(+)